MVSGFGCLCFVLIEVVCVYPVFRARVDVWYILYTIIIYYYTCTYTIIISYTILLYTLLFL